MTSDNNTNSIRLSQFNTELQGKLSKFDTLNDGALSLEEAVQGLVALQKQSNNYKRLLYLQIPIMILMLACMLGVNILAINITKELQASSNGVLVDKNSNPIMVSNNVKNVDFFDFLSSASASTYNDASTLQFGGFDDVPLLVLPIQSIIVNNTMPSVNKTQTTVAVSFSQGWFTLTSSCDAKCYLTYTVDMYSNNINNNNIMSILYASFDAFKNDRETVTTSATSQKASSATKRPTTNPPIVIQIQSTPKVPAACAAAGFGNKFAFG